MTTNELKSLISETIREELSKGRINESASIHTMAYWAAKHCDKFYLMLDTGKPAMNSVAGRKLSRDTYKDIQTRWNITADEAEDILYRGHGLWKEYFN